jgi:hypothetical protein
MSKPISAYQKNSYAKLIDLYSEMTDFKLKYTTNDNLISLYTPSGKLVNSFQTTDDIFEGAYNYFTGFLDCLNTLKRGES